MRHTIRLAAMKTAARFVPSLTIDPACSCQLWCCAAKHHLFHLQDEKEEFYEHKSDLLQ
jgi:hypothetical protein